MRKVWRDIADMNPLKNDNELVTYHSWFTCPLLDLQADSRTRMGNGGAPLDQLAFCTLTSLSMFCGMCAAFVCMHMDNSCRGILHLAQWKWPL